MVRGGETKVRLREDFLSGAIRPSRISPQKSARRTDRFRFDVGEHPAQRSARSPIRPKACDATNPYHFRRLYAKVSKVWRGSAVCGAGFGDDGHLQRTRWRVG